MRAILAIAAAIVLATPASVALSQQNIGGSVIDRAELANYERALPALRRITDSDGALIKILAVLTTGYTDYAELDKAMTYGREALAVARRLKDPLFEATSVNNLGLIHRRRGDYREALAHFEAARDGLRSITGDSRVPRHLANTLNNLGLLHNEFGRHAAAAQSFREALEIYRAIPRSKNAQQNLPLVQAEGNAQANLAQALNELGKADEAAAHLEAALRLATEAGDLIGQGVILNNQGAALNDRGEYDKAIARLQQAASVRRDAGDIAGQAATLNNLAYAYSRTNKLAEAESAYRESLALLARFTASDDTGALSVRAHLAALVDARGRRAEAETALNEVVSLLRGRWTSHAAFLSEREQLAYLARTVFAVEIYFSFCLRHHDDRPELVGQMFDLLLWQKGFVVLNAAAQRSRVAATGSEALAADVAKTRRELSEQALAALRAPFDEGPRRRLVALQEDALRLERRLAERVGPPGHERDVSWHDVRGALRPSQAAVEIARFRDHDGTRFTGVTRYVALVVTPGSARPHLVELGTAATVGEALTRYKAFAQAAEPDPARAQDGRLAAQSMWAPIERTIGDATRVFLAPDGALHTVNWLVLPLDATRQVLDTHDVRVVTSTRAILPSTRPAAAAGAVLVGNPSFADDRTDCTAAAWGPLPKTADEARRVESMLRQRGWRVETFLGRAAREAAVKAARSPRILHLATHGAFLAEPLSPEADPMLQSFVALAGANCQAPPTSRSTAPQDDGTLTAYEAASLSLRGTELVVLSACETGLGEIRNGEGVLGMRRALEIAGAQSVLMSLWTVPDQPTARLMERFYAHWLAGADKHRALITAQRELRAETRRAHRGANLPLYWGAFVLAGSS